MLPIARVWRVWPTFNGQRRSGSNGLEADKRVREVCARSPGFGMDFVVEEVARRYWPLGGGENLPPAKEAMNWVRPRQD